MATRLLVTEPSLFARSKVSPAAHSAPNRTSINAGVLLQQATAIGDSVAMAYFSEVSHNQEE